MGKIFYWFFLIIGIIVVSILALMSYLRGEPDTPVAVEVVREDAAIKEKVDSEDIAVLMVKSVDWPNSCLGLSQPGQVCAQVITPGYQITVTYKGTEYVYHTNKDGSIFVLAP